MLCLFFLFYEMIDRSSSSSSSSCSIKMSHPPTISLSLIIIFVDPLLIILLVHFCGQVKVNQCNLVVAVLGFTSDGDCDDIQDLFQASQEREKKENNGSEQSL